MARMSSVPPPGYRTQSPDTSYEAEQRQIAIWRAMTPRRKLELLDEMRRGALALSAIGARLRGEKTPAGEDTTRPPR